MGNVSHGAPKKIMQAVRRARNQGKENAGSVHSISLTLGALDSEL